MSETVGAAREDLLRTVAAGTVGVVGEEFLARLGETDWRMNQDEPMAAVWFTLA
jgi:hypothetical protein